MSADPSFTSPLAMEGSRLKVVLCWHMHQPQYQDQASGEYQLPWSYLHAIKDYVDMAYYLEVIPGARAVVNFAPILLEQISDYTVQIEAYLTRNEPLRDPLLAALVSSDGPTDPHEYAALVKACLRINKERFINRFPPYHRLANIADTLAENSDTIVYLSQQYLADIVTWYHLAWVGESAQREDPRIAWLIQKGTRYTLQDRHKLLAVIGELLGSVIGRYRRLAEAGRIELSMTPYAHPILPLLIDLGSALEAMPSRTPMPQHPSYPGGLERARWHIREGRAVFRHHFGFDAQGCWPAEGGISTATLKMLADEGYLWTASGETVLSNSLAGTQEFEGQNGKQWLYRPYLAPGTLLSCFFRDDSLSDLIGFTYATWHSDDAVNNLIYHLVNIADACKDQPDSVVSIIMDGENAWEYYPENGYYFLSALYKKLAEHPQLELTTFSSYLEQRRPAATPPRLTKLVAGSWVYGTFSTWIGSADKNHGWEMLGETKRAFDQGVAEGRLGGEQLAAAERQLGFCEGSDWFWWFGDYNPAAAVSDFERLFRLHLSNLYRMLELTPPSKLAAAISHGAGEPALGGVMRKAQQ